MKKALFLSIIIVVLALALPANAAAEITVFIDGEQIIFDVPPVIVEGRTLVPLRAIFEGLDMTVDYEPTTKMITGTNTEKRVVLQVNSTAASVTDFGTGITTPMALDVPAQIVASRTLVPLRFVGESTGATVVWDGPTRTINITTAMVTPNPENMTPVALGDPVGFTTVEQVPLVINVAELAQDTDLVTTDNLEIVSTAPNNGWLPNFGSAVVASDHLSLTFTSLDITTPATQNMIVEVTDGTYIIEVNVEIEISLAQVIIPNLPPVALANPVEFETLDISPLVINVAELAEDTDLFDGDDLAIASVEHLPNILYGTVDTALDQLSFTFTPNDMTTNLNTQHLTVEVTDGTNIIAVNVVIAINDAANLISDNEAPVAKGNPVIFGVLEQQDLVINVSEIATDINGDDMTIVSINNRGFIIFDIGTETINPGNQSFTFTSMDITSSATQYLVVRISDGTEEVDINVNIEVQKTGLISLNFAPLAKGDPVETYHITLDALDNYTTVSVGTLAYDLNGDALTIVSVEVRPATLSVGIQEISEDETYFTFTSNTAFDGQAYPVHQYLTVYVTDGTATIPVNLDMTFNEFNIPGF